LNKQEQKVFTVCLEGDLDHHNAPKLRRKIEEECCGKQFDVLVLDFSRISFMDSSGIGLVLSKFQQLKNQGKELQVKGATGKVLKIFELSTVTKIITFM
jgi:stage II sporulation protein AA (anti-sigma F factor antagonist)